MLSLDARPHPGGKWQVWSDGGHLDAGRKALPWALEAVNRGAGEVMVTSIERDGTGEGLDLALTTTLAEALPVPMIASGGCGLAQHVEGYQAGASAVAAGTFLSGGSESDAMPVSHPQCWCLYQD